MLRQPFVKCSPDRFFYGMILTRQSRCGNRARCSLFPRHSECHGLHLRPTGRLNWSNSYGTYFVGKSQRTDWIRIMNLDSTVTKSEFCTIADHSIIALEVLFSCRENTGMNAFIYSASTWYPGLFSIKVFSNRATPETQLHKNVIRCGLNIAFGAKEYFQ